MSYAGTSGTIIKEVNDAFNGNFRDDCLNGNWFTNIKEANLNACSFIMI
jgi:hypothetical protein